MPGTPLANPEDIPLKLDERSRSSQCIMKTRKLGRTHFHVSELCLNAAKSRLMDDVAGSFALLDAQHTCDGSFIQNVGPCAKSAAAPAAENISEDMVDRWQPGDAVLQALSEIADPRRASRHA